MPRDEPWIFRTYAGYGNPRVTNERFKMNLAKGQTGLSVAFDLPTQMGYDSDHAMAKGEVGRVGVAIGDQEHPVPGADFPEKLHIPFRRNDEAVAAYEVFLGLDLPPAAQQHIEDAMASIRRLKEMRQLRPKGTAR